MVRDQCVVLDINLDLGSTPQRYLGLGSAAPLGLDQAYQLWHYFITFTTAALDMPLDFPVDYETASWTEGDSVYEENRSLLHLDSTQHEQWYLQLLLSDITLSQLLNCFPHDLCS